LGYGREIYFWTLLAALFVLVAGALFSLREGIEELMHPSVTSRFAVAYVVLAISSALDLISFRQSAGQMSNQARRRNLSLLSQSKTTFDPSLRTVFVQDAVSVSGDVMAFAGLTLNQITGSSIPQGIVAVLIGLLLIRAGFRLVQRSHDFLVGAWSLTSPAPEGLMTSPSHSSRVTRRGYEPFSLVPRTPRYVPRSRPSLGNRPPRDRPQPPRRSDHITGSRH
jgi:divalent metal cation (Fe/Co/Zn/Cd) transporter